MAKRSNKSDKVYTEALQHIEACRANGDTELDLSLLGLRTLPPEIGQLTALTTLNLFGNKLRTLPPEFGQLEALEELTINDNPLHDLPECFGNLRRLKRLYLGRGIGGCPLGRLPEILRSLWHLHLLDANSCKLTKIPEWLGEFKSLTELSLEKNRFITLPPENRTAHCAEGTRPPQQSTQHAAAGDWTALGPDDAQPLRQPTQHAAAGNRTTRPVGTADPRRKRIAGIAAIVFGTAPTETTDVAWQRRAGAAH